MNVLRMQKAILTGRRAPRRSRAQSREEGMFDRKILLTVLVSGVVAGGAVQLLHAQTKPLA
jgi:hypothetical protein